MKIAIPCTWRMYGTLFIEADALADAIKKAFDAPLPSERGYIDDSFSVDDMPIILAVSFQKD